MYISISSISYVCTYICVFESEIAQVSDILATALGYFLGTHKKLETLCQI